MAKTTSNKAKSTKKATRASSKAQTVDTIRANKLVNHSNIVSICIFVSCITAVLVTLIFNFAMKFWIGTQYGSRESAEEAANSSYSDKYKEETKELTFDAYNNRKISSTAVIGMMKTGASGLVYIEPADCSAECVDFREQLSYTQAQKASPIFAVYLESNLSEDDELLLKKFKIDINGLPTLAYIKEGEVFDRLDSINSIDNLRNFVQKYRAE